MISYNQAKQFVIEQAKCFGNETIFLDDAYNRVIAETIIADRDYPPFNRAMMDGYALKIADWENGIRTYKIIETIYAGNENKLALKNGECYKIMTGAAVPMDADSIIKREDSIENNATVKFTNLNLTYFQHIAKRGEDLSLNKKIEIPNCRCSTATTALLAAIGKYEIIVKRLPTVAIITTGNEVVPVNSSIVTPVQIRNSNAYVLKSLLKKWEIAPVACEHVADNKSKLLAAIDTYKNVDILIINGGVSAGDADYVPDILAELGAKKIFHKVAIRPGKPIWFGQFEKGATIFALPGNPFSCMVTFILFIELYLKTSFKINEFLELDLPLHGERKNNSKLDEFFLVKINKQSAIDTLPFNSSGDITAALQANAIGHQPHDVINFTEGNLVKCILI